MKLQIDKSGVLYKSMLRGRTKLTVIFVVLFVLFFVYTAAISPYLGKRFFGPVPVDAAHYAENVSTVAVTEAYEPDKSEAKIYGYALNESSYWNGDKYYFSAELGRLEEIGLAYTMSGAVLTEATDTETDPVAVKVARENIERNHVQDVVTARVGDMLKGLDEKADVVVANIIADVVIMLTKAVRNHLNEGGAFVCSGIIREREQDVLAAAKEAGYTVYDRIEKGEWVALCLRNEAA